LGAVDFAKKHLGHDVVIQRGFLRLLKSPNEVRQIEADVQKHIRRDTDVLIEEMYELYQIREVAKVLAMFWGCKTWNPCGIMTASDID
jgi:hypothetical protein